MPEFGPEMPDPQGAMQAVAGIAILTLVLRLLVAIAAAVWMFRDAEARRRSGVAASLSALASGFYGMPMTVIVVCAWILFRPEKGQRTAATTEPLPDKLPPGTSVSPPPEEFLGELESKN